MLGCRPLNDTEIDKISVELSLRDRCIFLIGIRCGYRISEILSLPIKGVTDSNGNIGKYVKVEKRNTKGKRHGWSIPMHRDVHKALSDYLPTLESTNGYLFPSPVNGGHLNRCTFHETFKRKVASLGIDTTKVATHSMRKTFAKNVYEASGHDIVMVCKLMRHRSIEDTMKYLDVDGGKLWDLILSVE